MKILCDSDSHNGEHKSSNWRPDQREKQLLKEKKFLLKQEESYTRKRNFTRLQRKPLASGNNSKSLDKDLHNRPDNELRAGILSQLQTESKEGFGLEKGEAGIEAGREREELPIGKNGIFGPSLMTTGIEIPQVMLYLEMSGSLHQEIAKKK
ncbi:hypothetical protein EK904_000402 [Melospiza melodia maxima]|nr:hypothetical protein EK904_000402 [Melospiza melodia maxima]